MTEEEKQLLREKIEARKQRERNQENERRVSKVYAHPYRTGIIIVVGILLCCILILIYIGTGDSSGRVVEADGTVVVSGDSGVRKNVKSIPYARLKYDTEYFALSDVTLYDSYSDYEHALCVILDFDFSTLSEKSIHWMMEKDDFMDDTFDVDVYIDSPSNGVDFESMRHLYTLYSSDTTYVAFLSDGMMHDFSDVELTVSLDIKQPETYSYDGTELDVENEYTWYINGENDDIKIPVKDETEMSVEHAIFMEEVKAYWKEKAENAEYGIY